MLSELKSLWLPLAELSNPSHSMIHGHDQTTKRQTQGTLISPSKPVFHVQAQHHFFSNAYSSHLVGHTSVSSACFYHNHWLGGSFQSPSARIARFLPRVQRVLYHSLQHLCLILLQTLCNTAYFCRWCCDTARLGSWFLAVSTKPSLAMVAEHLQSSPESNSLPKCTAYHPQAPPSPDKAQVWGAHRYQTGCSVAWDLLSTVQTSPPGQWHRMKLYSPPPTGTRRKTKATAAALAKSPSQK